MIRLQISTSAARSIAEQAEYYQQVAGPSLARRWEAALEKAISALLHQPEMGALTRFHSQGLTGLRWIPVPGFDKHMIFYHYQPVEQIVIVQVLHSARDLETILDPKG